MGNLIGITTANDSRALRDRERHIALLERNQENLLTGEEQRELQALSLGADQLMLKKAHACAILHWRGQPIRDLKELSPN